MIATQQKKNITLVIIHPKKYLNRNKNILFWKFPIAMQVIIYLFIAIDGIAK